VKHDVPRLLCALEERGVTRDEAYLTGMYAVSRWLAQWANGRRPGFHYETCQRLARGAHAMVVAASARTGLNPDGCDATYWPAGDRAAGAA